MAGSRTVGSLSQCPMVSPGQGIIDLGGLKWGPGPWEGGEALGWAGPLKPGKALKALAIPKYCSAIFIYERLVKSNVSSIDSIHVGSAKEIFFFCQMSE